MPLLDKAFLEELGALDTEDCDPTVFVTKTLGRQTDMQAGRGKQCCLYQCFCT